jgi:hypothetical protein
LRKQLALCQERGVKPRCADDAMRITSAQRSHRRDQSLSGVLRAALLRLLLSAEHRQQSPAPDACLLGTGQRCEFPLPQQLLPDLAFECSQVSLTVDPGVRAAA